MRYLWYLTIVLLCLFSTSVPALSETVTIWQFGNFDGSSSELMSADSLPSTVNVHVDSSGIGNGLPEMHSPPDDDFNPDNCNIINVSFYAEPGNYTLLIGQCFTVEPETVTVSLDGSVVGTYTTVTKGYTHELDLSIVSSGSHTLTFQEFYGNNGYDFDAVALVSDALPLSADFITLYLDINEINSFHIEGGSPPYTVTSYDELVINVDESVTGERFFVEGIGDGSTTVTVRDITGALVEVAVTVGITDSQTTSTYDPFTGEVVIPYFSILGAEDSTHYELRGNFIAVLHMIRQLRFMMLQNPDMSDEQIADKIDGIMIILITGAQPQ